MKLLLLDGNLEADQGSQGLFESRVHDLGMVHEGRGARVQDLGDCWVFR